MKPRSMEEKIGYRLFLMGFVGLLCTAALCILYSIRRSAHRSGRQWSTKRIWYPLGIVFR